MSETAVEHGPSTPVVLIPRTAPIEAMRWTGDNWDAVCAWVYGKVIPIPEDWAGACWAAGAQRVDPSAAEGPDRRRWGVACPRSRPDHRPQQRNPGMTVVPEEENGPMATEEHMPTEERLRELLFGRKVVKAEIRDEKPTDSSYYDRGPVGLLTLDDGTMLKVWGNEGCACSAGCYPLTKLNAVDNAITNVEVEEQPDGADVETICRTCGERRCWKDGHDNEGFYRIFVVAEDRHLLASFDGSDGNGYYGTGWWLTVESADRP